MNKTKTVLIIKETNKNRLLENFLMNDETDNCFANLFEDIRQERSLIFLQSETDEGKKNKYDLRNVKQI